MSEQGRVAKVLAALLVSMTLGAIVLMLLGNNPPSAGAFSLSSYCHLDSVEKAVLSSAQQLPQTWNSIDIYYSQTKAGNIEQLSYLNGVADSDEINCHFVVCNGLGGKDGQIETTQRWIRQWPPIPGRNWYGSTRTIRICVIAEGNKSRPTDCQIRRVTALVERLCRKFEIKAESIYSPTNW